MIVSCRECKGRCRVRGVSRQAAEVCHSILALEASPLVHPIVFSQHLAAGR